MKKLFCIIMLLFPVVLHAQKDWHKNTGNIRKDRPLGISFCMGGGNLLGLSLDYFVIPQINIEAGIGFSQYVACKYHFSGGQDIKWSPYIGLGYGMPVNSIREASDRYLKGKYSNGVIAIPVGVHFIQKKGFSFSIEGVLGIVHYKYQTLSYSFDNNDKIYKQTEKHVVKTEIFPSVGLRIGYHF